MNQNPKIADLSMISKFIFKFKKFFLKKGLKIVLDINWASSTPLSPFFWRQPISDKNAFKYSTVCDWLPPRERQD